MKTRSLTGAIILALYIAIILLATFVSKIFFDIFMILIMLASGLEVSRAISKKFSKPIDIFILLNCIVGYIAFYFVHSKLGGESGGITAYFGVLAIMFIACIVFNWISKKYTMNNVISTMFVLIYPTTLFVYMLGLNYLPNNFSYAAILLLFSVSAFSDTMAYLVGTTVKGPKLCPSISPKKTISGAIGGIIGGIGAGIICWLFSKYGILKVVAISPNEAINVVHFIVLGAIGSVFVQLGDLIASYIKRHCGVKDFSSLLPGHGGIMDRLDGMILNAIFLYIYLTLAAL